MAITFNTSTNLRIGPAASTWSVLTQASTVFQVAGRAVLVALSAHSSGQSVWTITDNVGNVFTFVGRSTGAEDPVCELWYTNNIVAGSTRMSMDMAIASSGYIQMAEFSGISTGTPVLAVADGAITANSTEHTLPDITPSEANALVVAVYGLSHSTWAPSIAGAGWSSWSDVTGAGNPGRSFYIIQGAADTASGFWRTAAATSTGGVQHGGVIAAFSDTFAGAPAAGAFRRRGFTLLGVR